MIWGRKASTEETVLISQARVFASVKTSKQISVENTLSARIVNGAKNILNSFKMLGALNYNIA